MMNEIQEIRKSQAYLGSKYEEMKNELKTVETINKNLELENAFLKQSVDSMQKQSAETEAKVNNLEQYSRECCPEIHGIPCKDNCYRQVCLEQLIFVQKTNLLKRPPI